MISVTVSRADMRQRDDVAGRSRHRATCPTIGLLLAALLAGGCGWVGEDASPEAARAGGPAPATRVVALAPAATRFVEAIGAGDRLVGVDPASADRVGPGIPVVTDAAAIASLAPDLVLVPAGSSLFALPGTETALGSARVVEFEPHDLEDVLALCRDVGERLVGQAAAARYEASLARPLAEVGGASFGQARPRVLAVVSLDPPALAGGHSFETDLVEIAGGQSVTHGGESPRLAATREEVERLAPDLILVMTRTRPSDAALERMHRSLDLSRPVEWIPLETDDVWTGGLLPRARELKALLDVRRDRAPAAE